MKPIAEVEAMTPEARRIAAAEVCGVPTIHGRFWGYRMRGEYFGAMCWHEYPTVEEAERERPHYAHPDYPVLKVTILKFIPDYGRDLNAMRVAVQWLQDHGNQFQWLEYTSLLFNIIWSRQPTGEDYIGSGLCFHVIEATASQRLTAFLCVTL